MKQYIVIGLALLISGCAVEMKPDRQTEQVVQQHTAILAAITAYISDLQTKGVLPKPVPLKEGDAK